MSDQNQSDMEVVMVYVCRRCGARSYHPLDASERYCGRCHLFEGAAMLEEPDVGRVDE